MTFASSVRNIFFRYIHLLMTITLKTQTFFERMAMVGGKTYNFMTSFVDTTFRHKKDGAVVASIRELDNVSFPDETDHQNNRSLKRVNINTENQKSIKRREVQTTFDDGSVVDILCLYTRQALEELCNYSKEKKCHKKYLKFVSAMNTKCQLAVDQTVSSLQLYLLFMHHLTHCIIDDGILFVLTLSNAHHFFICVSFLFFLPTFEMYRTQPID